MHHRRLNGTILLSGRGSNMKALVAASRADANYPVAYTHVLSDKADAPGLNWAHENGMQTNVIKDAVDAENINAMLDKAEAEIICLAGYMRVLPAQVTAKWQGRMLNIHPSLLPNHKGLNAQAKALAAGDRESGATVHFVTAELDAGAIVAQESVQVLADDDVDSLSKRILAVEHQIFSTAVAKVANELRDN